MPSMRRHLAGQTQRDDGGIATASCHVEKDRAGPKETERDSPRLGAAGSLAALCGSPSVRSVELSAEACWAGSPAGAGGDGWPDHDVLVAAALSALGALEYVAWRAGVHRCPSRLTGLLQTGQHGDGEPMGRCRGIPERRYLGWTLGRGHHRRQEPGRLLADRPWRPPCRGPAHTGGGPGSAAPGLAGNKQHGCRRRSRPSDGWGGQPKTPPETPPTATPRIRFMRRPSTG